MKPKEISLRRVECYEDIDFLKYIQKNYYFIKFYTYKWFITVILTTILHNYAINKKIFLQLNLIVLYKDTS